MADVYFRVWAVAGAVAEGLPVNENKVNISGSAVSSGVMHAAGGNRSRVVRLMADAACFVTWGASPTVLSDGTEGMPLGSENPEYVQIQADHIISVIQRV